MFSVKKTFILLITIFLGMTLVVDTAFAQRRAPVEEEEESRDRVERATPRPRVTPPGDAPSRATTSPRRAIPNARTQYDGIAQPSLTWVVTGLFQEADQSEWSEVTITEPYVMPFRWGTDYDAAEFGDWRLVRVSGQHRWNADPDAHGTQIATGVAGPAPYGQFQIDLADYLPAERPEETIIYHFEVVARETSSDGPIQGDSPGSSSGNYKPVTSDVGPWSQPVVITYLGTGTQFDFDEVYTRVELVLDGIVLIEDQYGPGQEEYYITGLVQELFKNCADYDASDCAFTTPGEQYQFGADVGSGFDCDDGGAYFRCLNPPSQASYGSEYYETTRWSFNLTAAPRQFLFAVSMVEEDGGGSLNDWAGGFDEFADMLEYGDILEMNQSELEDFLEDNATEIVGYAADAIQVAVTIAAEGAAAATGIGIAVVAVVEAVSQIVADMEDDYYGTQVGTLMLLNNSVDEIHQLPGHTQGGSYIANQQSLRFYGARGASQAGSFDGIVEITFHWEFHDRELN